MESVLRKEKKPGRPSKATRRSVRAAVRFSYVEYIIIQAKARQAGTNVSEYMRQTAIAAKITPRLTTEDVHAVRQIAGMANNINQVAKIFNQQGMFEGLQYFESFRKQIGNILQKLKP